MVYKQAEFGEWLDLECKPGIRPFGPTPRLPAKIPCSTISRRLCESPLKLIFHSLRALEYETSLAENLE